MEFLLGCLFNSVWLIGSFLFGWLLFKLFAFVALPAWLEIGIIIALSFWVGMIGMATFIGKSIGKSWAECSEEARGLLIGGMPTGAACVVAVVCYLILSRFTLDAEIIKYIVLAVTFAFWFRAMTVTTERLERQNKMALDAYNEQQQQKAWDIHNEQQKQKARDIHNEQQKQQ